MSSYKSRNLHNSYDLFGKQLFSEIVCVNIMNILLCESVSKGIRANVNVISQHEQVSKLICSMNINGNGRKTRTRVRSAGLESFFSLYLLSFCPLFSVGVPKLCK